MHGNAVLGDFGRNFHQIGIGRFHDDEIRLHFIEHLLRGEARKIRVDVDVGLLHPHRFRLAIVNPADKLVVVLQEPDRIPLAAGMVVDDAPMDDARLALADRLPLGACDFRFDTCAARCENHERGGYSQNLFHGILSSFNF